MKEITACYINVGSEDIFIGTHSQYNPDASVQKIPMIEKLYYQVEKDRADSLRDKCSRLAVHIGLLEERLRYAVHRVSLLEGNPPPSASTPIGVNLIDPNGPGLKW